MDSSLGPTEQSRDDSFYRYSRNPGLAPGQPFDMGQLLPDEEPLPAGEYVGQDGVKDSSPDDGDFTTTDAFAIKINGSAPTKDSRGQPVYASSYTITVNSGDVTFKGPNVLNGEIGPSTLSLGTGVSATFAVDDGSNEFYIAYGKVVFTRVGSVASGQINDISESSKIVVEESTSHNFIEGWSELDTASPKWMFKIGAVAGQRQANNRYVFVNQIQVGHLVYGEPEKAKEEPDFPFKIRTDPDDANNYVVLAGAVNNVTSPQTPIAKPSEVNNVTSPQTPIAEPSEVNNVTSPQTPIAEPSEVWLRIEVNSATHQVVTALSIVFSEPAGTSTVFGVRIADIEWEDGVPIVSQYIRTSLSAYFCGEVAFISPR